MIKFNEFHGRWSDVWAYQTGFPHVLNVVYVRVNVQNGLNLGWWIIVACMPRYYVNIPRRFFQRTVATIIESSSDVLVIGQGGWLAERFVVFFRHNYNPFLFNKVVGSPSSLRKLGSILIAFVVHFHPKCGEDSYIDSHFSIHGCFPHLAMCFTKTLLVFPYAALSQHHRAIANHNIHRCNIFPSAVVVLSRWHPCTVASSWSRNAPWRSGSVGLKLGLAGCWPLSRDRGSEAIHPGKFKSLAHENRPKPSQKETKLVFQASIFRGELLNFGGCI